jgi:hypothetical protein
VTFKLATWTCESCDEAVTLRYHVETDGEPGDPPAPWMAVAPGRYRCPSCSVPAPEDFHRLTRTDVPEDEAVAAHRREHLCTACLHRAVCRYAPEAHGERPILATISRCREWVPDV